MFFTEEDYRKIEVWLKNRVIKDTQFPIADSVTGSELVPIVQDKKNKVVTLYNIIKQVTNMEPYDFYNVTDKLKKYKLTLETAVHSVPVQQRKVGLVITFSDANGRWHIYQFRGYSLQQWGSLNYWEDIITNTIKRYIDDNLYYPDEEDITGFEDGNRTFIKFKDRHPSEDEFISVGTVILRKNIQGVDECDLDGEGTPVNVLTQDMINEENIIYVIQYDFDLDGKTISVPNGSTLWFQGGSLHNGSLYLHDTAILGAYEFEDLGDDLTLLGTFKEGQIMTFHNDAYKAKEGKYFVKTEVPIEGVDETRESWEINPDAYVTTDRQEIRWWNGEEWVWILDAADYNELKSIINDLIEKHNIEIANLYSYIGNTFADIYEKIDNINNEISNIKQDITEIRGDIEEINIRIGNIEGRVTVIEGDIANIKIRLDDIDVEISNIKNDITNIQGDITNINNKITEIEGDITNIYTQIEDINNTIENIQIDIDNINTKIENISGDISTILTLGGLIDIKDNAFVFKQILPDKIYVKPTDPDIPGPDYQCLAYLRARNGLVFDVSVEGKETTVRFRAVCNYIVHGTYSDGEIYEETGNIVLTDSGTTTECLQSTLSPFTLDYVEGSTGTCTGTVYARNPGEQEYTEKITEFEIPVTGSVQDDSEWIEIEGTYTLHQ